MSKQTRHVTRTVLHDMTEGTACIAGAFTSTEFTDALTTALPGSPISRSIPPTGCTPMPRPRSFVPPTEQTEAGSPIGFAGGVPLALRGHTVVQARG
jgi:hypothetical protein